MDEEQTKSATNDRNLSVPTTIEDFREHFEGLATAYEPVKVAAEAKIDLEKVQDKEDKSTGFDSVYKTMTLFEFEKGVLLTYVIPEEYRTFGINMLRQLQKDYNCNLISEQATAELATVNFIRTLDLQHRINTALDRPEKHNVNLLYISILGKELDRANRHYLAAIQTLRSLKQPSLQFNIKAETAVVGQNQVLQA